MSAFWAPRISLAREAGEASSCASDGVVALGLAHEIIDLHYSRAATVPKRPRRKPSGRFAIKKVAQRYERVWPDVRYEQLRQVAIAELLEEGKLLPMLVSSKGKLIRYQILAQESQ